MSEENSAEFMIHYSGELCEKGCTYDSRYWEVVPMDVDDYKSSGLIQKTHVKYIGKETDLRKIACPAFTNMNFFCLDRDDIEFGMKEFHENNETVIGGYANCSNLIVGTPIRSSIQDASYLYDGTNTQHPPKIEEGVKKMNGTFANCAAMEGILELPDSVEEFESGASGCISISEIMGGSNVMNAKCAFAGCESLVAVPEIGASGCDFEDAFVGCPEDIIEAAGVQVAGETVKDVQKQSQSESQREVPSVSESEVSDELSADQPENDEGMYL